MKHNNNTEQVRAECQASGLPFTETTNWKELLKLIKKRENNKKSSNRSQNTITLNGTRLIMSQPTNKLLTHLVILKL